MEIIPMLEGDVIGMSEVPPCSEESVVERNT
jgi:hypothetical protein